jgi:hypothetical protein
VCCSVRLHSRRGWSPLGRSGLCGSAALIVVATDAAVVLMLWPLVSAFSPVGSSTKSGSPRLKCECWGSDAECLRLTPVAAPLQASLDHDWRRPGVPHMLPHERKPSKYSPEGLLLSLPPFPATPLLNVRWGWSPTEATAEVAVAADEEGVRGRARRDRGKRDDDGEMGIDRDDAALSRAQNPTAGAGKRGESSVSVESPSEAAGVAAFEVEVAGTIEADSDAVPTVAEAATSKPRKGTRDGSDVRVWDAGGVSNAGGGSA